jgi:hypothetical protein
VGRRSTLDLLRALRRRDREQHGEAAATAARESDAAVRAARAASDVHAQAGLAQERAVAAERALVESGFSTAGELMHSHLARRAGEERLRALGAEALRAEEQAALASQERARATLALERADAAEARVQEAIAERALCDRARQEQRDQEAAGDHWNSNAAARRSRGEA